MDNFIKKRVEFYCAYQERCRVEVIQKLKKLKIYGDSIEEYIAHLINNDFLNEKRFAESYVRGKFNNNNWGKIRIVRRRRRTISREIRRIII